MDTQRTTDGKAVRCSDRSGNVLFLRIRDRRESQCYLQFQTWKADNTNNSSLFKTYSHQTVPASSQVSYFSTTHAVCTRTSRAALTTRFSNGLRLLLTRFTSEHTRRLTRTVSQTAVPKYTRSSKRGKVTGYLTLRQRNRPTRGLAGSSRRLKK